MIIQHDKTDFTVGASVRDGDHDARKVKVYVQTANQDVTIAHNLGRVPRHFEITWKDGALDCWVSKDAQGRPSVDTEKIVLKFSAANVTAVIRFA